MAWKPEVFVQGKWGKNGLVFATEKEAADNAFDLAMKWTLCGGSRAVQSNDAVNYIYSDGKLLAVDVG